MANDDLSKPSAWYSGHDGICTNITCFHAPLATIQPNNPKDHIFRFTRIEAIDNEQADRFRQIIEPEWTEISVSGSLKSHRTTTRD